MKMFIKMVKSKLIKNKDLHNKENIFENNISNNYKNFTINYNLVPDVKNSNLLQIKTNDENFINTANNASLINLSIETLVKYNVQIIENLVKSAIDIDNKTLGTFYVLSALTLVSQPARDAMPWLYDAVVYVP